MAKYKIIVVGLLLANNQMANAGDFVDEEKFASPAKDLLEGGYIAKPTKADLEEIAKAEKATAASTKAAEEAAKAEEEAAKKAAEEAAKATK